MFDRNQLIEFKNNYTSFLNKLPETERSKYVAGFFGKSAVLKSIETLSIDEFGTPFLKELSYSTLSALLSTSVEYEVIGQVDEGSDSAHVLTRFTVAVDELEMRVLSTVSLTKNKENGQWELQLPSEIEILPKMLSLRQLDK